MFDDGAFEIAGRGKVQFGVHAQRVEVRRQRRQAPEVAVAQAAVGVQADFDDARMQPHEWVVASNGRILKTDGASHGDDHFFPGPTDIAWDVAGASIEWDLSKDALQFFLSRFQKLTGDDVRARLPVFMLAYCVVRLATCKLAITTVPGSAEESRLFAEYRFYRQYAERLIPEATGKEPSFKVTESTL